ncbi:MAG: hypothetical protein OHK0023_02860 [Anaerolineae bacterium]
MTETSYTATHESTYCQVHPTVETALRCNKCGRYMCTKCAVHTPVGYRCRECVYQQQDAFFKATQSDALIAGLVAFGLGLLTGLIVPRLGLFGALFLSLPAGALIGWQVFERCGRRRGRNIPLIAVGMVILTALITNFEMLRGLLELISIPEAGSILGTVLLSTLAPLALYLVMCCAVVWGRLK